MFLDLDLEWKGETYKIKSKDVWPLIKVVSNEVSDEQITNRNMPHISDAYSAALNFAGAKTTGQEVNSFLRKDLQTMGLVTTAVYNIIFNLICMPEALEKLQPKAKKKTTAKNTKAGKKEA